jgi:hypothetical protein
MKSINFNFSEKIIASAIQYRTFKIFSTMLSGNTPKYFPMYCGSLKNASIQKYGLNVSSIFFLYTPSASLNLICATFTTSCSITSMFWKPLAVVFRNCPYHAGSNLNIEKSCKPASSNKVIISCLYIAISSFGFCTYSRYILRSFLTLLSLLKYKRNLSTSITNTVIPTDSQFIFSFKNT